MSYPMPPALICSCHVIGLAVVRALGVKGVPIIVFSYDKKDMGCCSKYVKEAIKRPHPSIDEKGFIKVLLDNASPSHRAPYRLFGLPGPPFR
jgi:predicted ATP-grasp superfamily ATP-dependent carboligase